LPSEDQTDRLAQGVSEVQLHTACGGVTFVNRFTIHASAEEFERTFATTSSFLSRQAGFVRNTLLRSVTGENFYINIADWRDAESFHKAVQDPAFVPHAEALRALSTSEPMLYTPRQTFTAPGGGAPRLATDS
jgi:deoxynogalonate / 12-deoxyaklanonic acid monooxygenase